ncbi:MAG TPA: hypothetical protein VM077_05645 [Candidatus Limnocylindrales bacterium]|nr:hypothetical protein [Candidatus Limnocylindrales bacterium]
MATEKRTPQKTPGYASTKVQKNDNFNLPIAMYYDSVYFLELARDKTHEPFTNNEERCLRSALYSGFGFFEATLNRTALGHAQAHRKILPQAEVDILEEKETILSGNGHIVRKTRFYPLETRVSFLTLFLSGKDFNRNSALWHRFIKAKELRDTWTHPKPPFDTWSLTLDKVEKAIKTLYEMLVEISNLMEIEPPSWMMPFDKLVNETRKSRLHRQL